VWAAASLVPSAIAWPQYWTGIDPLHALGLRREAVHAAAPFTPGRYAAVGFFKWYQRLAHNLQPVLCVAAAVALAGGVAARLRALLAVAAVAASAAVVLTLSRASWVTLALSLGLVAALVGARARRFAVPVTIGAGLAMLLHPVVRTRLALLATPDATGDRKVIWGVCRAMVADRPLLGFGFGNLPHRSVPYYRALAPDWWVMTAWCHDQFFSAWAEGGPLLFAAVCAFWVLLARALWRVRREGDRLGRAAAAGALAAVAATFANSLAHDLLYSSEATYGLGFALAVAVALARERSEATRGA
jgi:O-antigen ligase